KNPAAKMEQALAAADCAIEAAPADSYGWTKKAFALYFNIMFASNSGAGGQLAPMLNKMISIGNQAIHAHSDDAYAYDIIGLGYRNLSGISSEPKDRRIDYINKGSESLIKATKINSRFAWAYNDLGTLYLNTEIMKSDGFESPVADAEQGLTY